MSEIYKGKTLITGAGGFIGGNLAEKLQTEGEEFVGTDNSIESRLAEQLGLVKMDVLNPEETARVFCQYMPKEIFLFAGWSVPSDSQNKPDEARKLMMGGIDNIFSAILEAQKIDNNYRPNKIIVAGSVAAFGGGKRDPDGKWLRFNEKTEWNPNTEYGRLQAEKTDHFLKRCSELGLKGIVVVQTNTTGVSEKYKIAQRPGFVIPDMMEKVVKIIQYVKNNQDKPVPKLETRSIEHSINIMPIDDLVETYLKLGKSNFTGKIVVGAEKSVRLLDIVQKIVELSKIGIKIHQQEGEPGASQFYDVSKLKETIGKVPRALDEVMLKKLLDRYKELAGVE